MSQSPTVRITKERLIKLLEAEIELNMLKAAGVDSWDGANEALYPEEDQTYGDYTAAMREEVESMDESTIVEE